MNKKFKQALTLACKDFGLTDKAIEDLSNLGVMGLTEDSTDEDIKAKVDSVIPFAKAMQGEITRKAQAKNNEPSKTTQSSHDGVTEGNKTQTNEGVPTWFAEYSKQQEAKTKALEAQLSAFQAKEAANARKSAISTKGKELGIPDYLLNRINIADDADYEQELTNFKQELVTNSLLPKDAVLENGKIEDMMKADADSWADSLPDA